MAYGPFCPYCPQDYAASARSLGCDAVTATTVTDLAAALERARASDRATVIVCPTAPDRPLLASGAFWDLGVPQIAADPQTQDRAAGHQARSLLQRPYT